MTNDGDVHHAASAMRRGLVALRRAGRQWLHGAASRMRGALALRADAREASGRLAVPAGNAILRDGTVVQVRAVRPDDTEKLRVAFERLSARSVYRRFLHPVKALSPEVLRRITDLDFHDRVGLVMTVGVGAGERLVAEARFVRDAPDSERAEFAIVVADDYQNRGAATLLLQELVAIARSRGIRELCAHVLEDNTDMLDVIRRSGLPSTQSREDGVVRIVSRIGRTSPGR